MVTIEPYCSDGNFRLEIPTDRYRSYRASRAPRQREDERGALDCDLMEKSEHDTHYDGWKVTRPRTDRWGGWFPFRAALVYTKSFLNSELYENNRNVANNDSL